MQAGYSEDADAGEVQGGGGMKLYWGTITVLAHGGTWLFAVLLVIAIYSAIYYSDTFSPAITLTIGIATVALFVSLYQARGQK